MRKGNRHAIPLCHIQITIHAPSFQIRHPPKKSCTHM